MMTSPRLHAWMIVFPNPVSSSMRCKDANRGWARLQGALSWEPRAATSLARLRQNDKREAEAHAVLASVYARFTQGFDTTDLKKAKALLVAMAPPKGPGRSNQTFVIRKSVRRPSDQAQAASRRPALFQLPFRPRLAASSAAC